VRWILLLLVVATGAVYWRTGICGFVNLDDDVYVYSQPMVNLGLRPAALSWAFSSVHSNTWHPLTSLSHMLDCTLFGLAPAPMHWENLGWHLINTVLVFVVWRKLTSALWSSALVAALFALHPLHVESVAWISGRKDLLSTFFWLLGLGAYARYAAVPDRGRYFLMLLCFALGLLAKPMIITFPCTLLLLDYWPLRRWPKRSWPALLKEKLPLFGLAAAFSVLTYVAQKSTGAADFGQRFALDARIGNALVSYARYLGKTFWPESLAPFYPHPGYWPGWCVVGTSALLIALSALAWWQRRDRPWFVTGWLWFLGTDRKSVV
jgi:protein O-mannosyl-transferase